jgi:hypothetical protein
MTTIQIISVIVGSIVAAAGVAAMFSCIED